MFEICKGIGREQSLNYNNVNFDRAKMSAMDIACGYHSYLFAIASLQLQVSGYIHICNTCQAAQAPFHWEVDSRLLWAHTFNSYNDLISKLPNHMSFS